METEARTQKQTEMQRERVREKEKGTEKETGPQRHSRCFPGQEITRRVLRDRT